MGNSDFGGGGEYMIIRLLTTLLSILVVCGIIGKLEDKSRLSTTSTSVKYMCNCLMAFLVITAMILSIYTLYFSFMFLDSTVAV